MGNRQVRIGQLIAPFGPGSIYTDRDGVPQVVAGLDHWFKRWDQTEGKMIACSDRIEFERFEPRLSALLGVDRFCLPPDYRIVRKGDTAPPNALLNVPAQRFPRWYRHTRTGQMRRFNLQTTRVERPPGGGRWQPVRFISVCTAGHLCEFPWKEWIGCQCSGDGQLVLTDGGGSELSSIHISCQSCPDGSTGKRGRNLSGTTVMPDVEDGEQSAFQKAGIRCPGDRPWLGEGANIANCNEPLVGALINQTNIYFPRTISAIALPDLKIEDDSVTRMRNEITRSVEGSLGVARTIWNISGEDSAAAYVQSELSRVSGLSSELGQVKAALASLFSPQAATVSSGGAVPAAAESELLQFRRSEFNVIRNELNDPDLVPDLRIRMAEVPVELAPWIGRVNLVERLRETRAFFGFDRLKQSSAPLESMPTSAMLQLFRSPPVQTQERWLPAAVVFGEGLYIELDEARIEKWQSENAEWLRGRLDDGFITRLGGIPQTLPPLDAANRGWASRYLLVHSLAHILINQLIFDCGYSTAALRERLYVSCDPAAPMAGFLIYTAAGDSEGTLGGLVRLGRPELFGPTMQRALSRASWCSADPICSEHLGGQGSKQANLAACHACTLLPETSCETINHGLDRAVIVGTPVSRHSGFMSELLEESYVLG
jgi:hypothetical protein